jgi:glycerol-1-phosphate dehydrogenase [NAD(P)+]
VEQVIYAEDALGQLPEVCAQYADTPRVTLIADQKTQRVAGDAARIALAEAGWTIAEAVLPNPVDGHDPICDDHTRAWIEERTPDASLYVAVGSGVVNDLTKWISGDRGAPYVVVGTAASMNGYSSSNIAPTVNNVKTLLYGRCPVAILTSPKILADAPAEMTASGLGDVLAKPVSTSDWLMNHILFEEYHCSFCADLINDIQPLYLNNPESIADRSPEGISALFDALIFTGLAMTMAGTSVPASGAEHLIAHTIDMMAMLDGTHHDLHGRQVGVATIVGAALYEEVFAMEKPTFADMSEPTDPAFWGRFSDGVELEHAQKRAKAARAVEVFDHSPGRWDEIRERIRPRLLAPEALRDCLKRAGAACRLQDIAIGRDRFVAAMLHAHEMRERYTILDLARAVGVLPERAEEIVTRWVG